MSKPNNYRGFEDKFCVSADGVCDEWEKEK